MKTKKPHVKARPGKWTSVQCPVCEDVKQVKFMVPGRYCLVCTNRHEYEIEIEKLK